MIKTGTNYDYNAREFLDRRQGLAKTEEDLKNWAIPVPHGFEICLPGGTWYYFNPEVNLPKTGHWIPKLENNISENEEPVDDEHRSVSLKAGKEIKSRIGNMSDQINIIEQKLFPLQISGLSLNGRGASITAEPGEKFDSLKITWTNLRNGENVDGKINSGYVTSPIPGDTGKIGMTYNFYNCSVSPFVTSSEPRDYNWNIHVEISSGLSASSTVRLSTRLKKFWGTSEYSDLSDRLKKQSDLVSYGISGSTWGYDGLLDKSRFDCTGGRYPYILIPGDIYNSGNVLRVGGFVTTDFTVSDIELSGLYGYSHRYKMYRLNNIQTGQMIIELNSR